MKIATKLPHCGRQINPSRPSEDFHILIPGNFWYSVTFQGEIATEIKVSNQLTLKRLSWINEVSQSNGKCPLKMEERGREVSDGRKTKHYCCLEDGRTQQRNEDNFRSWEKAMNTSPPRPPESGTRPCQYLGYVKLIWTCDLQNCKLIILCCVKMLCLW